MANIFTSSIGRKLIMSVTGCFLVLFLTFHMVMNLFVACSPADYNKICEFLGANWYALAGTAVLAAGVAIHFIYAFVLTIQNLRARGNIRYAVTAREDGVAWASKNMFILGLVVILGLLLHLVNFWSKMQLVEIMGSEPATLGNGMVVSPADGAAIVQYVFSKWYFAALYIVWLAAIWFHLTHGMWSMMHTVGWNSKVWIKRLQVIANTLATLLIAGFALVVVVIFIQQNFL